MQSLGRTSWRLAWWVGGGLLFGLLPISVLAWYSDRLSRWQLAALAAALAAADLFLFLRLSGRTLVGPILFYDLVRSARQGRHALFRCLYLAALLVMLFLLYVNRLGTLSPTMTNSQGPAAPPGGGSLMPTQMAQFAEAFFETFAIVQFVVIVLLTPGCTAGAIAEEKERRTIEYLLTTDLRPIEIVFGKLAARLAYLALLLLTGLPVLGFLQLLGGVDPQLVLAAFAATGVTMLSLACLSILNSILVRKPRTAILLTYVEAALYLVVSTVLDRVSDGTVELINVFTAGNVFAALRQLQNTAAAGTGTSLTSGLPTILRDYALFHGAAAALCLLLALLSLRRLSRWQAGRRSQRSFAITFLPRRRPRVGAADPVFWKEMYVEPMFRFGRVVMPVVGALLYGVLILGAFYFICLVVLGSVFGDTPERVNGGVRVMGTLVMGLMLLGVAVRASTSISGERDRQTLDSLLSSPLPSRDILWGKWLGSLLSVRRLGWYVGAIWLVGIATGGLNLLAVPLLAAALFIYGAFLSSLGMVFSLFCRTTVRATLWTLVTMLALSGGHWLCGMCINPLLASPSSRSRVVGYPGRYEPAEFDLGEWVLEAQKYALTPPLTLYLLAYHTQEIEKDMLYLGDDRYPSPVTTFTCGRLILAVGGLGCYGIAAWALYVVALGNFARKTGRMPVATSTGGTPVPPVGPASCRSRSPRRARVAGSSKGDGR
jgi:ABC-type transport system involved in multi-copper enzyme maturation permease subunit